MGSNKVKSKALIILQNQNQKGIPKMQYEFNSCSTTKFDGNNKILKTFMQGGSKDGEDNCIQQETNNGSRGVISGHSKFVNSNKQIKRKVKNP